MFKHTLWVLALCVAFVAGGTTASSKALIVDPGVDTLAPQVTIVSRDCGKVCLQATETRNIPNPPTDPPGPTDQVDRGIASITITGAPSSYNARLILVTDNSFPRDPAYYTFDFCVEAIDASQKAVAYIFVRDWADNFYSIEVTIEPQIPTPSTDLINTSAKVNETKDESFTITNTTGQPMTISSITINGSGKFTIVEGGSAGTITLAPGEVRTIKVRYTPDASSVDGDEATVVIATPCGDKNVALKGEGLVATIEVEDWKGITVTTKGDGFNGTIVDSTQCKPGFWIWNRGNVAFDIQSLASSDPRVTFSGATPAPLPYTLNPGDSVLATVLCVSTAQAMTASVAVNGTYDAGDNLCEIEVSGVTGVEDEIVKAMGVRYNASNDVITFNSDRVAKLVNITGIVVATSQNMTINVNGLTTGAYFVVFEDAPQVVVPVMVTH